jgi:hypothetical protein
MDINDKDLRQKAIKKLRRLKNQLKVDDFCSYCKRKMDLEKSDPEEYYYRCIVWDNPDLDPKIEEIKDEDIGGEEFDNQLGKHDSHFLGSRETWILSQIDLIKQFFNITGEEEKNV